MLDIVFCFCVPGCGRRVLGGGINGALGETAGVATFRRWDHDLFFHRRGSVSAGALQPVTSYVVVGLVSFFGVLDGFRANLRWDRGRLKTPSN